MKMYLHGSTQARWDSTTSHSFNVTNGMKQGSVISPLFFTLYVDELIDKLVDMDVQLGINIMVFQFMQMIYFYYPHLPMVCRKC